MARFVIVALCMCLLSTSTFGYFTKGKNTLTFELEPELVSQLLRDVEHTWINKAMSSMAGKMQEKDAKTDMVHSCLKVCNSIVKGSDGDRERVSEYMGEVCGEKQDAQSRTLCEKFGGGV